MPVKKITKGIVDAATAQARPFIIYDADLKGFGLMVRPSGVKTYIAEYRAPGTGRAGAKKRLKIGAANKLAVEEARKAAKGVLSKVELGDDPLAARKAQREACTVADLLAEYLRQRSAISLKPRTAEEYRLLIQTHLVPALGKMRATELTRARINKFVLDTKDAPYSANRSVAVLSAAINWGKLHDLVPGDMPNPCAGVDKYKETKKERFLSSEELSRLGDALRLAESEGLPWDADSEGLRAKHLPPEEQRRTRLDPFAVAAIRLLIFTGARLREILHARWTEYDAERGVLLLADSKTGAKSVYLSAAAQAVLSGLPHVEGNPHIIPGAKEGAPRADLKKPWAAICRAAGLGDLRLHDLRHSFASVGAGRGLGLVAVGKLLGHNQAATTARYSHLDADPLKRAVETIGADIDAAMNGGARSAAGDVVPLRRQG